MSAWTDHVAKWRDCTRCPLSQQRHRIVMARGMIPATVLFVGEAPGASEDAIGSPFVGPAGLLLDQIVERALPPGTRYAMTNLVACFPREAKEAGTNEPAHSEILTCRERLLEFVDIVQPKLIVCVGTLADQYVVVGGDVRKLAIVHPAAILHMPLVQRNMAVQKSVVVIRCAVEDLQCQ